MMCIMQSGLKSLLHPSFWPYNPAHSCVGDVANVCQLLDLFVLQAF